LCEFEIVSGIVVPADGVTTIHTYTYTHADLTDITRTGIIVMVKLIKVRFQVLTAGSMKMTVF
jgi:hypothetical protein